MPSRRTLVAVAGFTIACGALTTLMLAPERTRTPERFPPRSDVVLQQEKNDCAPACLTMTLRQMGVDAGADSVRSLFVLTRTGASVTEIGRVASLFGVATSGWMLRPEDLRALRGPAILHVDSDHYIVLDSLQGAFAFVRDPAAGRRRIRIDALTRRWSGAALLFGEAGAVP